MMSTIGCEDVCAAIHANIDRVPAVNILIDLAWIVPILECFRRWAVVLLVSFLPMFRTLRHASDSPTRCFVHYSI